MVLSCHHSRASREVRNEYLYALSKDKSLLLVLLDHSPLPEELKAYQYIDMIPLVGRSHDALPDKPTIPIDFEDLTEQYNPYDFVNAQIEARKLMASVQPWWQTISNNDFVARQRSARCEAGATASAEFKGNRSQDPDNAERVVRNG